MAQLYVANLSKQNLHFAYRVPERLSLITQIVPIGGQTQIKPTSDGDLPPELIDYIVSQHAPYGMVAADEVGRVKGSFPGYVYSIGKPLSTTKLQDAMEKHEQHLNAMGRRIRQEAALAVNNQLEDQLGVGAGQLRGLEMSFQEVEPRGGYTDDGHDPAAEGIRVAREDESTKGYPVIKLNKRA